MNSCCAKCHGAGSLWRVESYTENLIVCDKCLGSSWDEKRAYDASAELGKIRCVVGKQGTDDSVLEAVQNLRRRALLAEAKLKEANDRLAWVIRSCAANERSERKTR